MENYEIEINHRSPFVSVIMPVKNEALFIERSLGAVLQQTYPKHLMEIIVADGMSTDDTRDIIREFAAETDVPIIIVDNPKGIAPSGLNCGIKRSIGEIIIRVDGHCEIGPDYIENCVSLLTSGKADGVGGPIETVGEGIRSGAIARAMSSRFGIGGSGFRTIDDREIYTDTVAFPGYTREIIEKVGLFDEEMVRNQDDEYNFRIRELGGKILLSPDIRSRYYSRSTFGSLWRQYFQYGYWKVRVFQLHPRQMSVRHFVPLAFVLVLMLLAVLAIFFSFGGWLLAAVIASYVVTNLGVACYTARRNLDSAPVLSLSFFILHFSYGLGSLSGLIAFRRRWYEPAQKRVVQKLSTAPE